MDQGRERIDHIFELGLVLLSIISAFEFQYFLNIENNNWYVLKVFVIPFSALIIIWIVKELSFLVSTNYVMLYLLLTDFCWSMWGAMLFFFLILMSGGNNILEISLLLPYIVIILLVDRAYGKSPIITQNENIRISYENYYRSRKLKTELLKWAVRLSGYIYLVVIVSPPSLYSYINPLISANMDLSLRLSDIIDIIAIIASPIIAIGIGEILRRRNFEKTRKLEVLINMMGYRHNLPSNEFLSAINSLKLLYSNDEVIKNLIDKFWDSYQQPEINESTRNDILSEIILKVSEKEGFNKLTSKDIINVFQKR